MLKPITQVAVAILQRKNNSGQAEFLLASRPAGKGWAGWWEFPGGKIEVGETPEHALARELTEELGIKPTITQQWLTRQFDYPETADSQAKTVRLHFYFVTAWAGEIAPQEGQQLSWQLANQLTVSPILPANVPIMRALALPPVYAISNIAEMGESAYLDALQGALNKGLRLIQIREKYLIKAELITIAQKIIALAKPYDAKVLISQNIALARDLGADGVHLPSQDLLMLKTKPSAGVATNFPKKFPEKFQENFPKNFPESFLVAASCHNAVELQHAENLKLDFVLLSPVKPTLSHPDEDVLGWQQFATLSQKVSLPVYALGGMTLTDLPVALSYGARGVALQRGLTSLI